MLTGLFDHHADRRTRTAGDSPGPKGQNDNALTIGSLSTHVRYQGG